MVRSTEGQPTATIEDIPNELLDRVCAFSETAALKSLRLTSKTRNASAITALFNHVEVLPTKESVRKCIAILRTDYLNAMVTHIAINTSLTPEHEDESENGGWPSERILPDGFDFVLFMIGKFEKLKQVSLRFSRPCVAEEEEGWGFGNHKAISARDTVRLRHSVLRKLLQGLRHKHHPAKISSLTIMHLQNILNDEVGLSDDFASALSGLISLSLQIAGEVTDFPETDDMLPEPQQFFGTTLPKTLLLPAARNLQHLKLYSNDRWGFWPFFDFRNVHFPSLTSLVLGNFTFFYDAQLEWITSHGGSLRSLILDDCAIVPNARLYEDQEALSDAIGLGLHVVVDDTFVWEYSTRWHDYFRAFSEKLVHLRHFGIGHGAWNANLQLEESGQIGVELRNERYLIFDYGTLPDHWFEPEDEGEDEHGNILPPSYDCCWADDEDAPKGFMCNNEDLEALAQLLDVMRSRKGASDHQIASTSVKMNSGVMAVQMEENVEGEEDKWQQSAARNAEWDAYCRTYTKPSSQT